MAALIEQDPRVWSTLAKRIDLRSKNGSQTAEREDPEARSLLTKRQQQVLEGVCDGLTNQDIATRLGVSEGSVKATLQQLFRKMFVRRRAQLVRIALEESFERDERPTLASRRVNPDVGAYAYPSRGSP